MAARPGMATFGGTRARPSHDLTWFARRADGFVSAGLATKQVELMAAVQRAAYGVGDDARTAAAVAEQQNENGNEPSGVGGSGGVASTTHTSTNRTAERDRSGGGNGSRGSIGADVDDDDDDGDDELRAEERDQKEPTLELTLTKFR